MQWRKRRWRCRTQACARQFIRGRGACVKKDRFVRIGATEKGVNWDLVEQARQLVGLKGYVTNLPTRPWADRRWLRPITTSGRSGSPSAWPDPTYGPG